MKIALATSGLWQLQEAIELITGGEACRLGLLGGSSDAIAGWGHKPTAARGRRIARLRKLPYLAFEDGFLRSVHPGNAEKPLSLVLDRSGIYYDARLPSDLEALVHKRMASATPEDEARAAIDLLRRKRLSKYNNSTLFDISALKLQSADRSDRVLVVDQTAGDASIAGALAGEKSFLCMLRSAVAENPGSEILIRVHPETIAGRKAGHFTQQSLEALAHSDPGCAQALQTGRMRLTPEPVNPWVLLEACAKVYCVSSQLGFEGLMAGCEVHTFGVPFYSGWGLTRDRNPMVTGRRAPASLEALSAALYFDYSHYIDHQKIRRIGFAEAATVLEDRIQQFARTPDHNGPNA
ncbi:hypothetical protein [Hoeflea ulvae]|uniref:Beta-3-deoxy-D-manno-oct-2-ulosonic acid transferase n=1 Tax=Hoeflea ulvae TaxID=2983764 RepID=A0ABT3YMG0_9HYPH|nr:hypothetical protein [Hoeflea ulvae]MCY0096900.1 hypothetical protein [Hoeflea ulvae]